MHDLKKSGHPREGCSKLERERTVCRLRGRDIILYCFEENARKITAAILSNVERNGDSGVP